MKFIINPIACQVCEFYECVCSVILGHQKECDYRRAVTCLIPIECDHGYDVCLKCDVCNCKEIERC